MSYRHRRESQGEGEKMMILTTMFVVFIQPVCNTTRAAHAFYLDQNQSSAQTAENSPPGAVTGGISDQ